MADLNKNEHRRGCLPCTLAALLVGFVIGAGFDVWKVEKTHEKSYKKGVSDGACYWELRRPDSEDFPPGKLTCGYSLDKRGLPTSVHIFESE